MSLGSCPHGYVWGVDFCTNGTNLREARSSLYRLRREHKALALDVYVLLCSLLIGDEELSSFAQEVIERVRKAAK